jgi:integrase
MGLGSLSTFGLADVRAKAAECRRLTYEGADPIDASKAERARAILDAAKGPEGNKRSDCAGEPKMPSGFNNRSRFDYSLPSPKALTFRACTEQYIAAHGTSWRNAKHAAQWRTTVKTYAEPVIGSLPVQNVATEQVVKIIEPLWATKPETASRLRGRIEAVLDWATARGYRQGDNPAKWRGHLDKLLPARAKVRKVKHHAALPYKELPAFMASLRRQEGVSARALEFLILTAARTGEISGAWMDEIEDEIWTIPAARMKAGTEHRVPLSAPALAIAEKMRNGRKDGFLFPGGKVGKPLSNMAMLALLERMGRPDLTSHGFRSTFRDWTAECTGYPREVAEMALAHVIENKVEAAYRRGDLFEKRLLLMAEWATFCSVVPQLNIAG